MTTIFTDGFESGSFNDWTNTQVAGTHSETVEATIRM
jgi:hypothetical protein